jgi:hypothetical protein
MVNEVDKNVKYVAVAYLKVTSWYSLGATDETHKNLHEDN